MDYVHGYGGREQSRLIDQAGTLADLLHVDTRYPPGSAVLEVGCGVGAQTASLIRGSPGARITAIDRSEVSLAAARRTLAGLGGQVEFRQADLFALPFAAASFDHLFVCFVLEHLSDPLAGLVALRRVLKAGGTITVIEGDHGSVLLHPESAAARRAIDCQVALQARAGGDALIGRRLAPLLIAAGFEQVSTSPRMVLADASRPDLVDGFSRRTFTAMIAGVRAPALAAGLIDAATFDRGIAELEQTTAPDGVMAYSFFKALGRQPG